MLAGRVISRGGVAAIPTSAVDSKFKDDFILASMYQLGWDGTGSRGAENCDVLHTSFSASTGTADLTSKNLSPKSKCTYFISTSVATVAPAFELKSIGTWSVKWQL